MFIYEKQHYPYAGFWKRAGAMIIDILILSPLAFLGMIFDPGYLGEGESNGMFIPLIIFGIFIAPLFYDIFVQYFWEEQTIGKKAFNIKIVQKWGGVPSIPVLFLRYTVGRLISLTFIGLGFFWMLFNEKKQTWHDMIFGTYVIEREPVGRVKY